MSKNWITSFSLLLCGFTVLGQRKAPSMPSITIDDHLTVKDSTGKVLSYDYWYPLLTTGQYSINTIFRGKDTLNTLKYLPPKQRRTIETVTIFTPAASAIAQEQHNLLPPVANLPLPAKSLSFINGEKMEPFKARDIDNNKVDTKSLEGKIVVINFWFINCPACRIEIPELNDVVNKYAGNPDVVFLAICLDQRWDIKDFLKKTPYNYRQIADGQRYGDDYKVTLYPTNVVLDRQGIIRFNSVGADNTGYWLKKTVDEILAATNSNKKGS